MIRHNLRIGCLAGLVALLAAGPAGAEVTLAGQRAMPAESGARIDFPAEGRDAAAAARTAMAPCGRGAVSQTWHMACMFEAVWGSSRGHRNHPPPHSAAFLAAAMAEASAQTTRYRTRESEVYRHLARHFAQAQRQVPYAAFLDATGQAFRQIRVPDAVMTAEATLRP